MCRLHAFERASDPKKLRAKCGISCHMHLKEHPTLRSLGQNVEYLVSVMLVTWSSVNAQTSGCAKQIYYAQIHTESGLCTSKLHLIKATRNIHIPRSKCFWAVFIYIILHYIKLLLHFPHPFFISQKWKKKFLSKKPCLTMKIMFFHVFSLFLISKNTKKISPSKKIIAFAFGWVFLDQNWSQNLRFQGGGGRRG